MFVDKDLTDIYFSSIDKLPNVFDATRKGLEKNLDSSSNPDVMPMYRLHEQLLKRFHGHRLTFNPVLLSDGSFISLDSLESFDLYEIVEKDSTDHGQYIIDWLSLTLFANDQDESYDPMHLWIIDAIAVDSVTPYVNDQLEIRLTIHLVNPVTPDERLASYVSYDRIAHGAIVLDGLEDILPEKPIKLSDVNKLTGIAQSSLSDLRRGNKRIRTLSLNTASLLTRCGDIRYLDRYIIDATIQSVSGASERITPLYRRAVDVTLSDGRVFTITLESMNQDDMDQMVEDLYEKYVTETVDSHSMIRICSDENEYPLLVRANLVSEISVRCLDGGIES